MNQAGAPLMQPDQAGALMLMRRSNSNPVKHTMTVEANGGFCTSGCATNAALPVNPMKDPEPRAKQHTKQSKTHINAGRAAKRGATVPTKAPCEHIHTTSVQDWLISAVKQHKSWGRMHWTGAQVHSSHGMNPT